MLEEHLGDLLSPVKVQSLLAPAVLDRDYARQALDDRAEALTRLAEQLASGIWHSRAVAAAVAAATSDRLLLRMSCTRYVGAHNGQYDLDNAYHPLLPASAALSLDDITTALAFIGRARSGDSPELWFGALRDEASACLHQLRGDIYLARAIAKLDALDAQLIARLDPTDPYAARNIRVHSAAIALFREQRLPWRVEAAYRRFLASFPDDPFAGWHARADADPAYRDATLNAYYSIVLNTLDALCLRNPGDRTEIERLNAEEPPSDFAPVLGMYEPDVVALPALAPAVFEAGAAALHRIAGVLKPASSLRGSRAVSVLWAWEAFARRGLNDFRWLANELAQAQPDDEAYGIVLQALRGEAYYKMGRYEDAYLDLLGAEEAARAALDRRTPGAHDVAAGWTSAERDGVARFAQAAGNALATIGDEQRAGAAYDRAAKLAVDPLARAGNLINRGNRFFQRNSAVGDRGYITLDAEARQDFVLHGGKQLIASIVGKHVASLCDAEASYRAALDVLAGEGAEAPGAQALAATCEVNLGNVAWAWGQTLVTEGESRLGKLPLSDAFASELVSIDSDARACYEAALAAYEACLVRLGATQAGTPGAPPVRGGVLPLVTAALSGLSEMRYLVGREILRDGAASGPDALNRLPLARPEPGSPAAESLNRGIAEAQRCLSLLGKDARALQTDLFWRTHYNLARMHRLFGRFAKAAIHFRHAIRTVERLRAELRLDSFQSSFLRDKHDVYEGYIDLLLAHDRERNAAEIFALFERSRARAFLALLQTANVKARLPERLQADAEVLLAEVSACNESIQAAVAADCRDEAEALLAEQSQLALRWADMQSKIARAQRRGRRLPRLSRLADFQAALAGNQGYLSFLFGDEASYALIIDRSSARVFRLPPRRTIEFLALPVLTYATWSNAETACEFREANVALTRALLGPIDAEVGLKSWLQGKHLLISPDGILCYLPLETLLADMAGVKALPETAGYSDFAPCYLLSLADISYVPSASAWLEIGRRKREPSQAGLMAVYNVLYDTAEPPQWAVAENIMLKLGAVTSPPDMKRITDALMKAWGQDTTIVRLRSRTDDGSPEADENQSTERNFLRVAPGARARMLLFHGHGIYNDRYPSLSGLVFNLTTSPGQAGRAAIPTAEDGFLRVEELFQLKMPGAEMTMLAACQTALGAYRRGEGLGALVRAFLYQGSPAVMATLWEVRADITARILRAYFGLLAEQPDADRARLFSQARRKAMPFPSNLYLPYFWAPFVLWGHTAAPSV